MVRLFELFLDAVDEPGTLGVDQVFGGVDLAALLAAALLNIAQSLLGRKLLGQICTKRGGSLRVLDFPVQVFELAFQPELQVLRVAFELGDLFVDETGVTRVNCGEPPFYLALAAGGQTL